MDTDTKLMISWHFGNRETISANEFMPGVASRYGNLVLLATYGRRTYLQAVENAFDVEIDFAQSVKLYGNAEGTKGNTCYGS